MKQATQMTDEELGRFLAEPRVLPIEPAHICWKSSTGLQGVIILDENAELKNLTDKISAALRSHELNTDAPPAYFEMILFLREIS